MRMLFFLFLLFLLGVNGALFWQNLKAEEHAACPLAKKKSNNGNAVLVPGSFFNLN